MNLTELLDKNISLKQRVAILKNSYNNDFKELENLDTNLIHQITIAINDLMREVADKQTELDMLLQEQNRILNETVQVDLVNLSSSNIRDLNTRKNAAKAKVDEIMKEKSEIGIDSYIVEKLNDKKISIEDSIYQEAKRQTEIAVNNTKFNIDRYTDDISFFKIQMKDYLGRQQGYKEQLAMLIGEKDTPLKDEIFNSTLTELEKVEEKIIEYNKKLEEYTKKLEDEQTKLAEYEKNAEKILKKEERKEEKEQKNVQRAEEAKIIKEEKIADKRENLESYIQEFELICGKDELSFLEKEKRTSLYHVLANSNVIEQEEKDKIFNQYIKSINKTDKEIIGKCNDELKPQKQIPIISSVRSVVAKGAIATINKMSSAFDKIKNASINIVSDITQKMHEHKDEKIDKIGKLKEFNESLRSINAIGQSENDMQENIKPMGI